MDDEIRERHEALTSRLPVDSRIDSEQATKVPGSSGTLEPPLCPTPISVPVRCLQRGHYSNRFCVPAALALLLDCHVDHAVALIWQEVGEQPIEEIYYPLILKILQKQGYKTLESRYTKPESSYLLVFPGHCGVWIDQRFYDNQIPEGSTKAPNRRVEKIFRVWKVAP